MLKRKIINNLTEWKNSAGKMCLMLRGARQIGKTFSIREFAKENYEHTIEINFDLNNIYKEIFSGALDFQSIYKQITLYFPDANLKNANDKNTLLFLDEIQNCPRAIAALKFLADNESFDVIASGSLLGINYKFDEITGIPVGYVDHLEMHALDFEEFLWANGMDDEIITDLKRYYGNLRTIPVAIHSRFMELFKEYIVIGGMPRVVQEFVDHKDFSKALQIQRGIILDYKKDIAKYAIGNDKAKARECFDSIPAQLAKEYKKFQYKTVEKNGSARKYEGSIMWLIDAGTVIRCNNLAIPALPLSGNSIDNEFKIYMRDTGLLVAMLEDGTQASIIKGDLGIYKGAIFENIIADTFTKSGKQLFYYARTNRFEIDFIIRKNDMPVPVEVKAADNTKSRSLNSMISHYGIKKAVKLSAKNIGENGNIISVPLYMAMFL